MYGINVVVFYRRFPHSHVHIIDSLVGISTLVHKFQKMSTIKSVSKTTMSQEGGRDVLVPLDSNFEELDHLNSNDHSVWHKSHDVSYASVNNVALFVAWCHKYRYLCTVFLHLT